MLPSAVPLPEVCHYEEQTQVVFGNLGLPQGFDEERLIVNLKRIDQIRRWAGLGTISITSETGTNEPYDITVTSVDSDGAITSGKVGKRTAKPIGQTTVDTQTALQSLMTDPNTHIKRDTTESQERIREAHMDNRGELSPKAQAAMLNACVKRGLYTASKQRNLRGELAESDALLAIVSAPVGALTGDIIQESGFSLESIPYIIGTYGVVRIMYLTGCVALICAFYNATPKQALQQMRKNLTISGAEHAIRPLAPLALGRLVTARA